MRLDEYIRLMKARVPKLKAYACRFLESRGLRFCVDFGTENAIEKASAIVAKEAVEQSTEAM